MLDLMNEQVLPLAELPAKVAKLQPDGKKLALSSLRRWAKDGVRGIKLETAVIGGVRHTSLREYVRFVGRVTAARDGRPAETPEKQLT